MSIKTRRRKTRSNGAARAAMETLDAVDALMALAHETRLGVFRMLVRAGPDGVSAGAISESLAVTPSTLSHHLATLERSGLLTSRRHQRQIFYACAYEGMRDLLEFLTTDCCQGSPEICGFVERMAPPVPKSRRDARAASK